MANRRQQARGGPPPAQRAIPAAVPDPIFSGRGQAIAVAGAGFVLLAFAATSGATGLGIDTSGASLPLVFLTGLLAGGLTCLAVQGGLLASVVARRAAGEAGAIPAGRRAAPIVLFLAAKLVAYTALGGLLGLFGSVVGLGPAARGWLQILAAVFMLAVAAQLLDLHPIFRRVTPQTPHWLRRRVGRAARAGDLFAPAALGALTVFIPCGTTQAMMVAAVGTADPLRGAAILFAFVLGTTPLFFALGYLATRLGETLQHTFRRVAAVVVATLAAFSLWAGFALTGMQLPDVTAGWRADGLASPAPAVSVPAPAAGVPGAEVQEVTVRAEPSAYVPNRVQFRADQPARLRVVTGGRVGCTSVFTIPSLDIERAIGRNSETIVDIPTDRPGRIKFTCGMGMYSGTIEVVR